MVEEGCSGFPCSFQFTRALDAHAYSISGFTSASRCAAPGCYTGVVKVLNVILNVNSNYDSADTVYSFTGRTSLREPVICNPSDKIILECKVNEVSVALWPRHRTPSLPRRPMSACICGARVCNSINGCAVLRRVRSRRSRINILKLRLARCTVTFFWSLGPGTGWSTTTKFKIELQNFGMRQKEMNVCVRFRERVTLVTFCHLKKK